jgi:hypothetical protein
MPIGCASDAMDAEETRDGALIEMESNAGTSKDKRPVCRQRCCGGNSFVCQHIGYQQKSGDPSRPHSHPDWPGVARLSGWPRP